MGKQDKVGIRLLGLVVATLWLVLGLGHPLYAQGTLQATAIALTPGNYLTIDNMKISVATVSCNDGGTGRSPIACTNLFLAPATGSVAGVIIEAANGSTPGVSTLQSIFSYSCPATGSCNTSGVYDLGVTLDVQALTTDAEVTGASMTLAGSATPPSLVSSWPGDVHATEVFDNGTGVCPGNPSLNTNLANLAAACPNFAQQITLTAKKDIGLALNGITNGTTLALTSVTENFAQAPEPASAAMLLAGLTALGLVRRKRHRI